MMNSGNNFLNGNGGGNGGGSNIGQNGLRVLAHPMTTQNNGIVYSSTSYDDNFAENKKTLAHSQFGFLPSILKSFY